MGMDNPTNDFGAKNDFVELKHFYRMVSHAETNEIQSIRSHSHLLWIEEKMSTYGNC
jgi:hypothetical protein